jgi:hypothetical protein
MTAGLDLRFLDDLDRRHLGQVLANLAAQAPPPAAGILASLAETAPAGVLAAPEGTGTAAAADVRSVLECAHLEARADGDPDADLLLHCTAAWDEWWSRHRARQ